MKAYDKTYRWFVSGDDREVFLVWIKEFMSGWNYDEITDLMDRLVFINLVRLIRLMDRDTFFKADPDDQYYYDLQLEHLVCIERMTRIIQIRIGEENEVQQAFQRINTDINLLINYQSGQHGQETANQDTNDRGGKDHDPEIIQGAPATAAAKNTGSESGL